MTMPQNRLRRRFFLAIVLLAAAGGAACSTDKSAKTTPIKFVVQADQLVNPNARGEPSPLVVRIYELKSTTNFSQAQFFELFDNDTKRLGPDLVAKRELELKPGDKVDFERETPIETKNIGITAGFRLGDDAQWRTTAEVKPDRNNSIVIKVTAQAISVEEEASRDWFKVF